jgi:hypothetical protein
MLGLVVAVLLAGSQAESPRQQWVCRGLAKGERGAEVSVLWYLEADGKVVGRGADWTPPQIATTAKAAGLSGLAPDLAVALDTEPATGRANAVLVSADSEAGPQLVEGSTVTLKLDDGRRWSVSLERIAGVRDVPPLTFRINTLADAGSNPELLAALETARGGEATLTAKDGRRLGQVRYDLSARAERDRLFRQAWAAAERAARRPLRCDKAQPPEDAPVPTIPAPSHASPQG